ncbi:unnamed protein product, partial [Scytosiphon promiscuus]
MVDGVHNEVDSCFFAFLMLQSHACRRPLVGLVIAVFPHKAQELIDVTRAWRRRNESEKCQHPSCSMRTMRAFEARMNGRWSPHTRECHLLSDAVPFHVSSTHSAWDSCSSLPFYRRGWWSVAVVSE